MQSNRPWQIETVSAERAPETAPRAALTRLSYVMLAYTLTTLFMLPGDNSVRHALIALPLFGVILALIALRAQVAVAELLLGGAMLTTALISGHYDAIADAAVVAVLLLMAALVRQLNPPQILIDRRLLWGSSLVVGLVLASQLLQNFGTAGYSEFTSKLAVGDTNFSGVVLLFYLYYCVRTRFRAGIVLTLVAVALLLSRAYLVALLVYGTLLVTRRWLAPWLGRLNFAVIFLGLNVLLLGYAMWVLAQSGIPDFGTRGLERLVTFDDRSALTRLEYNLKLLERMQADPQLLWFGEGERFADLANLLLGKVPHNSLFHLLGTHGLLVVTALLIGLTRLFTLLNWRRHYVEVIPLIVYSLFLHGLFGKSYLLMIGLTLMVQRAPADGVP